MLIYNDIYMIGGVYISDVATIHIVENNLYAVAYSNNTNVATGIGGKIKTFTDGRTWTAQISGTMQKLNDVVYKKV